MFNLEQAIAGWRRQMLAGGVKHPDVLDELEGHLREDVERQMRAGSSQEEAFEMAVQRIGQASSLGGEFAKIAGKKRSLLRRLKNICVRSVVPFPSVCTFSTSARQTMELARSEAPRLHHDFIGTEHVLLGLLALESGVVPNVLQRMGVNRDDLRRQIEKWAGVFSSGNTMVHLPYTPRVKKALRLAAREARACNQDCVGAEHLFLGLLLEGGGLAAKILKGYGLRPDKAREEILNELDRSQ